MKTTREEREWLLRAVSGERSQTCAELTPDELRDLVADADEAERLREGLEGLVDAAVWCVRVDDIAALLKGGDAK